MWLHRRCSCIGRCGCTMGICKFPTSNFQVSDFKFSSYTFFIKRAAGTEGAYSHPRGNALTNSCKKHVPVVLHTCRLNHAGYVVRRKHCGTSLDVKMRSAHPWNCQSPSVSDQNGDHSQSSGPSPVHFHFGRLQTPVTALTGC